MRQVRRWVGLRPSVSRREASLNKRDIVIDNPILNQHAGFASNAITTAKYTLITFIPRFLYAQFSKVANIFFLMISIIQQLKDISPTNRFSTIIPLAIVILASAAKEVYEDILRVSMDVEVNNRKAEVLKLGSFVKRRWKDIRVGDIVRISSGDAIPADIILINTSEPDGLAFIETSNLDGETNLKIRQALPETANLASPDQLMSLSGCSIQSEIPNNSLYTFTAVLNFDNRTLALGPKQLLLRGATLRNTGWSYGVVVFTGVDTKIMQNSRKTPFKVTDFERITNRQILNLFLMLVGISAICAVCSVTWRSASLWPDVFLGPAVSSDLLWNFLTFIILFNSFIPISLVVTMEVVKLQHAYFINNDLDMYCAETDTPATARASSLVEELGQVDFVFTDKTGTLTRNIMEFRQCIIDERKYIDSVPADPARQDYKPFSFLSQISKTAGHEHDFLTMLAVCHTCIPDHDENDIRFQGSSPDEIALVKAAVLFDYVCVARRPNSLIVRIRGEDVQFEILNVLEFNSTRKRMSTIVRLPSGQIRLMCKGADSVILERLDENQSDMKTAKILDQLEAYAIEGLRTLCLAVRDIAPEEYAEWKKQFDAANTSISNRSEMLDEAAEIIEKNLYLLGATAIEDKLQEGVPETIHTLQEAGIKVWALTGDRNETAVNVGYASKLITDDMIVMNCSSKTHEETREFLLVQIETIQRSQRLGNPQAVQKFSLVIEGHALCFALDKSLSQTFTTLAVLCNTVICCRVSPLQKALVVKLVKKSLKCVTLAIGDGANDVSMIQAAHIGVGISGLEGLQAARSSDFAIGQFRFLKKLLLVHGHWSYRRLSKLVLFCFYKNALLYLTLFWFSTYAGFSGQTLYESWTLSAWNVIFTLLPPFAIGVFDQYVTSANLLEYPVLYKHGQFREFFNSAAFWGYFGNATFHSLLLFFFVYLLFPEEMLLSNGQDGSIWLVGTILYSSVLVTVVSKAALMMDSWSVYSHVAIWGSLLVWFAYIPIYSFASRILGIGEETRHVYIPFFQNAITYFVLICAVPLCLTRDFAWKYVKRQYFTRPYHVLQEMHKYDIDEGIMLRERFRQAVFKVRGLQRRKRDRGYSFSQNETGEADLVRRYDTFKKKKRLNAEFRRPSEPASSSSSGVAGVSMPSIRSNVPLMRPQPAKSPWSGTNV